MMPSLDSWQFLLRDSGGTAAIPLLIAGAGMMLFGWRLWRLCVVCSFAIIGAGASMTLFASGVVGGSDWLFGVGGAALFGLASFRIAGYLVAVLGGIVAAGAVGAYLQCLGVSDGTMYALAVAAMCGGTAYAFLHRRHVVVLLTAFLGAAALVSGIVALVMTMPGTYSTLRAMTSYSPIVGPFLLLVPTVVSCLYQISEIHKLNMEV